MPIHEYRCEEGHTTEKVFLTFTAAEKEREQPIVCIECGKTANLIQSVPFPAHLLGNPEGYYKPSPTKRHSTKIVSEVTGNKFSAS